MKRIVHITSVHPVWDTRILERECRSLAGAGYHVRLIAPGAPEATYHGVNLAPLHLKARGGRMGRIVSAWLGAVQNAGSEQADLFHLHDPELLPVVPFLRRTGAQVVFDMHEHLPSAILSKGWIPRVARRRLSVIVSRTERLWLKNVPVVFAEKSYRRYYPGVRHSVDVLNLPLVPPEPPLRDSIPAKLIYVGAVAPSRGSNAMFAAVRELWRRGHEVRFECVGTVRESARDAAAALASEAPELVRFHGRLSYPDAMEIVRAGGIGLALLRPIPNYEESFPTKMFEYMAHGLPVVVSNFPLYREVVEGSGCGRCVDPQEGGEIADALDDLLCRPKEAMEMGGRGRQAVEEKYRWDVEAEKLLTFYDQVLNGRSVATEG